MATLHSSHPVSGSIGDFTYSHRNGKTIIRQKPGISREKFLTHPRLQLSRENAQTFGGASKIACAIYSSLCNRNRKILAPYSHNKLIAKLLKGMRRKCHFVEDIRFTDIAHLLRDIDLSPTIEVSKRLQATTLGPNHCPETLILNGIHQAASLAQGRSRNRIEFRIELKYIEIPEVTHRNQKEWTFLKGRGKYALATSNPTNWIPVEILPQEPLKLSLHHAAGKQIPPPTQHPINPRIQIQEAQHPNDFPLSPDSHRDFILHQNQLPNKHLHQNQHPENSHLSSLISHQTQHPNDFPLSSFILHQPQHPLPASVNPANSENSDSDFHLSSFILHQPQPPLPASVNPANSENSDSDFPLSSLILHQNQNPPISPTAIFLQIEWREVNEETNEVISILKDKTITKLVALQMDQETAEQLAHLPPLPKPILDEYHEPAPPDWRQSPADYLAQSLANLQAPPPS